MTEDKFLVRLVHSIGQKQAFFILWGAIAGFFVWLMTNHYRKVTRRNFRPDSATQKTAKTVVTVDKKTDASVQKRF